MDDYGELEKLHSAGYFIVGPLLQPGALSDTKRKAFVSFFGVTTSYETLCDPANKDKFLVMLRYRSTGERREILTSDSRAMELVRKQLQYQEEPIGTVVHVRCAALGGRYSSQRIFHIDELLPSLDGIMGWKLVAGDFVGTFSGEKRLQSVDNNAAKEVLAEFDLLLDCLTILLEVGFYIQHYSISPITRCLAPTFGVWGPEETMLRSVSVKDIEIVQKLLSNPEASDAAKGLRQAYCESLPASRLWRMWAAVEDAFNTKPERLLEKGEVEDLMICAEGIEGLKGDSDRLMKLREALLSHVQLSRVGRNERIANKIASVMGISVEEAKEKVREASRIRGKHSHEFSADVEGVEDSEKFLQEALRRFLDCQIKSGNDE